TFQSGLIRARLSRGVIRLERLSLTGTYVDLWVEGTATVQGRLNLVAVARTGTAETNSLPCRLLLLRIPAVVGPLPLTLVVEASRYLANRTIQMSITGTFRNPVVRIQ